MTRFLFFLCFSPAFLFAQCEADFIFQQDGETIELVNISTGMYVSESWDFGDGNTNNSSSKPTHTYTVNGEYNVCLILYESLNDSTTLICDTTCQTIIINSINEDIGLFIEDSDHLNVFPNPVSNVLNIQYPSGNKIKDIKLHTLDGGVVILKNKKQLTLKHLPSGIYVLSYTLNDFVFYKKILKI
ncbi:MAG: hypothetical protein CMP75_02025 [Flavobacteriales bacterium]|nr:hypothetical protein [Flavobacteriales bacterium]|tara:strand:- start:560 stop:1117 length:558 start_codon:yes stop_codon:yes gene_type:complete